MDLPIIWTVEQVQALNDWQACDWVHPFTCGSERRHDDAHQKARRRPHDDLGQLVATRRGWVCPGCDYVQTWAHPYMFDGPPPDLSAALAALTQGKDDPDGHG